MFKKERELVRAKHFDLHKVEAEESNEQNLIG